MGSLGSELSDTDAHARRELAAGFRRWETSIANGLREMRSRGELLPGANPDDLALAVLAAAQGGILLAQIHRETRPLETALDTIIDHIESLVVRPRRPRKASRSE